MATSEGFKDFVLEQLARCAEDYLEGEYAFSARKMFGEYCVYIADLCANRIRFAYDSRANHANSIRFAHDLCANRTNHIRFTHDSRESKKSTSLFVARICIPHRLLFLTKLHYCRLLRL